MLEFVITAYLHFDKEELFVIFLDETLTVTRSIKWLFLHPKLSLFL